MLFSTASALSAQRSAAMLKQCGSVTSGYSAAVLRLWDDGLRGKLKYWHGKQHVFPLTLVVHLSQTLIDHAVQQARGKINPNLRVRPTYTNTQTCKKLAQCMALCSKSQSTSCINGRCKCNDPVVNFIGNRFLKSVAAIGNAPITKAIGHLMQGIADVKEVLGTILGTFLGPEAKLALKAS
ncbi:hypothetical protein JOM56_000579 [Amanita muscaria]